MEKTPSLGPYMSAYFEYAGAWGTPSKCGLHIAHRKDGRLVAIVTELYRDNPGTTVTEWCTELAALFIKEYELQHEQLIFIEHTPDLKSSYDFYGETFDWVSFDYIDGAFKNPRWKRLTQEEVDSLLKD